MLLALVQHQVVFHSRQDKLLHLLLNISLLQVVVEEGLATSLVEAELADIEALLLEAHLVGVLQQNRLCLLAVEQHIP
jgi:hypothetical protein